MRNGRFAAEYRELKQKEGRDLDPRKTGDSVTLRNLLLNIDENATIDLKEDIKKLGQKQPGIVTNDGYVINGNRRMAVLQSLYEETYNDKWAFLEVARLPKSVSDTDLWKIEAGLQLGKSERLDYGPMNTLLKFKEGVDSGLTPAQIAKSLFGNIKESEIKESLDRLTLIDRYLAYVGQPQHYSSIEKNKIHEHFVELQKILNHEKRQDTKIRELQKITDYVFELIKKNTPHRELRDVINVLRHPPSRDRFLEAKPSLPKDDSVKSESRESTQESIKDAFDEARHMAKADELRNKPLKLLNTALIDLESIDPKSPSLHKAEANDLIRRIIVIIGHLKQAAAYGNK